MPAETPGRRLQVLTSGLHQLATRCAQISAQLAPAAVPRVTAGSGWPYSAATASTAATAAGKDLARIGTRINTRGADYSTAGSAYTQTENDSAAKLRALAF
jgi:hypothetical protein